MTDRILLELEQQLAYAQALKAAQAEHLRPKKKPYLDESRPLTGTFSDYATTSCEPRFKCHTDKQGFQKTYNRMMRNLVDSCPINSNGGVYTYANGRIENINLEQTIEDIRGMDEIPD